MGDHAIPKGVSPETFRDILAGWAAVGAAKEPRYTVAVEDRTDVTDAVGRQNAFLEEVGLLEADGQKHRLTPTGADIAGPLLVAEEDVARENLRAVLAEWPVTDELRGVVRDNPMRESDLVPVVAAITGADPSSKRVKTGARTLLQLLEWVNLLDRDDEGRYRIPAGGTAESEGEPASFEEDALEPAITPVDEPEPPVHELDHHPDAEPAEPHPAVHELDHHPDAEPAEPHPAVRKLEHGPEEPESAKTPTSEPNLRDFEATEPEPEEHQPATRPEGEPESPTGPAEEQPESEPGRADVEPPSSPDAETAEGATESAGAVEGFVTGVDPEQVGPGAVPTEPEPDHPTDTEPEPDHPTDTEPEPDHPTDTDAESTGQTGSEGDRAESDVTLDLHAEPGVEITVEQDPESGAIVIRSSASGDGEPSQAGDESAAGAQSDAAQERDVEEAADTDADDTEEEPRSEGEAQPNETEASADTEEEQPPKETEASADTEEEQPPKETEATADTEEEQPSSETEAPATDGEPQADEEKPSTGDGVAGDGIPVEELLDSGLPSEGSHTLTLNIDADPADIEELVQGIKQGVAEE